ncbi:MAG: hypothetical protein HY096_00670 [Nitrospinae bacterium]|nr:hypothetical protein [Nitrospinota bacterium]
MAKHYFWWFFPGYNGKIDGQKNIPFPNQTEQADFEMEVKNAAEQRFHDILGDWERDDIQLKHKYCTANEEYKRTKYEYEDGLLTFPKRHDYEMPTWLYTCIVIALAVFDFYMYSLVFDVFEGNNITISGIEIKGSYLLASAICLALPLLGHFEGKLIRLYNWKYISSIALMSVTLLLMMAFAIARHSYILAIEGKNDAILSPLVAISLFLLLSIITFVAIILCSYFHHSNPRLEAIEKRYKKAQKRLNRIREKRKNLLDSQKHDCKVIKNWAEEEISIYRKANLRYRTDNQRPISFTKYPEISWPESEFTIDENCTEGIEYPPQKPEEKIISSGITGITLQGIETGDIREDKKMYKILAVLLDTSSSQADDSKKLLLDCCENIAKILHNFNHILVSKLIQPDRVLNASIKSSDVAAVSGRFMEQINKDVIEQSSSDILNSIIKVFDYCCNDLKLQLNLSHIHITLILFSDLRHEDGGFKLINADKSLIEKYLKSIKTETGNVYPARLKDEGILYLIINPEQNNEIRISTEEFWKNILNENIIIYRDSAAFNLQNLETVL